MRDDRSISEDWGQRCGRWRGVRSETLTIDGMEAHVLRADGPDDAAGVPQLLVHGLGGCAANWLEVLPELAARGPVIAPDLPGFGRTEPRDPGASRIEDNARFLEQLLDHLGWTEVEVHGNSMGGMLSVLLAERTPHRVARLVLAAPALPTPRRALHRMHPLTLLRFSPFLVPGLGAATMQLVWRRLPLQRLWREMERYVHADPSRIAREITEVGMENLAYGRRVAWRVPAFAAAAESLVLAMVAPKRLLAAIDAVEAPTLVVWGDQDRLVCRAVVEHCCERQPSWDCHVLEGVGHVPMLEAPAAYVAAVTERFGPDDGGDRRRTDRRDREASAA